MAYPKPPEISKQEINRAGKALVANEEDEHALNIVTQWRGCHAYPINTFQMTLRDKVEKLNIKNPLIAQRLKRMPTIIDKLRRYPDMNLARMQDIGGLRIVVASIRDVRAIEKSYKHKSKKSRFEHSLINEKDYIISPRSEDGYRSLHLIFSYKNRRAPNYDGLMLELQIRTQLQHYWATAVETMGIYLNQPLKSRLGEKEWIDFFALASSAFAHIEKLPLVPRFEHMGESETFKALAKAEKELQVLEKLTAFASIADIIGKNRKNSYYHLITLNIEERTVRLQSFAKSNVSEAQIAYAKEEEKAIKGEKIEPVLVAAGSIDSLKRAYPNFFLNTSAFVNSVRKIIDNDNKR